MEFFARNVNEALFDGLQTLFRRGRDVVVRGQNTIELDDVLFIISNPLERCIFLKGRNDNIFAKVAETLWVLAGRNDIKWLSHYLPRAADFSDDGSIWRGGYGPRLRDGVDQVMQCVNILSRDPESRRAVMTIFDPDKDFVDSKDIPCNIAIHWLIRDGFLNMKVFQRSSDIWWGFSGINTFEWSVLHQLMASWLNVQVGTLAYFISSLHLYERHFERAEKLLSMEPTDIYESRPQIPWTNTPIDLFDNLMTSIFMDEECARRGDFFMHNSIAREDPLLNQFSLMLMLYNAYNRFTVLLNSREEIACIVNKMESCDLKLASLEYLLRQGIDISGIVLPEKDRNILSLQI